MARHICKHFEIGTDKCINKFLIQFFSLQLEPECMKYVKLFIRFKLGILYTLTILQVRSYDVILFYTRERKRQPFWHN